MRVVKHHLLARRQRLGRIFGPRRGKVAKDRPVATDRGFGLGAAMAEIGFERGEVLDVKKLADARPRDLEVAEPGIQAPLSRLDPSFARQWIALCPEGYEITRQIGQINRMRRSEAYGVPEMLEPGNFTRKFSAQHTNLALRFPGQQLLALARRGRATRIVGQQRRAQRDTAVPAAAKQQPQICLVPQQLDRETTVGDRPGDHVPARQGFARFYRFQTYPFHWLISRGPCPCGRAWPSVRRKRRSMSARISSPRSPP